MTKKNISGAVLFCILAIVLIPQTLVQSGCANILPPEGGPRDTLPPELVRASPPEYSTDVSTDRITLTFNEYVDLNNYQQNLIISPLPASAPTITRKLNTVTIKLRDNTLEPNTTYTYNFGKSIKDVNEGNPMEDFQYVFSTGPYIDSLTFAGRVVLAETGGIDTTLTVMLHRSGEDSALFYERPRYITKLDGKGNFIFRNLSPGTFYLYALKDETGTYRYTSKDPLFAFADSAVVISEESEPVVLYAYSEKSKDVMNTATAGAPSSSRNTRRSDAQTIKRLKYQTNLQGGMQDLLERFILTFETPLENFDSSKIHFTTDTTFIPINGYHWEMDSTMKKAELVYPWKENTLYNIIMEKDFATDTLNQQLLKGDTLSFRTKNASDYGKVSIKFRNIDITKNPVLVFLQGEQAMGSYPLTSETFTSNMFVPGEYTLRIIYDENKNGKWDPGEFYKKHKQPEFVIPLTRKITIRSRWSNDFEINL